MSLSGTRSPLRSSKFDGVLVSKILYYRTWYVLIPSMPDKT